MEKLRRFFGISRRMTEGGEAAFLGGQAERCLRLAGRITDHDARASLRNLAMKYQLEARRIERGSDAQKPVPRRGGSAFPIGTIE